MQCNVMQDFDSFLAYQGKVVQPKPAANSQHMRSLVDWGLLAMGPSNVGRRANERRRPPSITITITTYQIG